MTDSVDQKLKETKADIICDIVGGLLGFIILPVSIIYWFGFYRYWFVLEHSDRSLDALIIYLFPHIVVFFAIGLVASPVMIGSFMYCLYKYPSWVRKYKHQIVLNNVDQALSEGSIIIEALNARYENYFKV